MHTLNLMHVFASIPPTYNYMYTTIYSSHPPRPPPYVENVHVHRLFAMNYFHASKLYTHTYILNQWPK